MYREDVLKSLLAFDEPIEVLESQLAKFEWDSEDALGILSRRHSVEVLKRFLDGALSAADVENWANLIEGRDDINFEPNGADVIKELIHELANPILTRELTHASAKEWITRLK